MVVGMAVLGGGVRLILAMFGDSDYLADRVGLRALVMTANMTIGMAVWMRHRGHGWGAIAEMSAAMFVPLGILIRPVLGGCAVGRCAGRVDASADASGDGHRDAAPSNRVRPRSSSTTGRGDCRAASFDLVA